MYGYSSSPTDPIPGQGRDDFEIAIICALTLEANAVQALFEHHWDHDGPPFGKAAGDANAYSTGYLGHHDVVLAYLPGMGKANAAAVTASFRASFPNIKLALVVGVCGVAPFVPETKDEIILGDVIISDGIVQYDFGRLFPEGFVRKDTLLDSLPKPNMEICALSTKLKTLHGQKLLRENMAHSLDRLRMTRELKATYPGVKQDRLYESSYRHVGDKKTCQECGCSGPLVSRCRLEQDTPQPAVHFGLMASGDKVIKAGLERDDLVRRENVIGFEMEGAGVCGTLPCVVIKGACDYADSHKTKAWQNYAAATAAACAKAFLDEWVPSVIPNKALPLLQKDEASQQSTGPWFLVPFPKNDAFVGRSCILDQLQQFVGKSRPPVSLFGLGGIGKTQIALAHVYWLLDKYPDMSVFWVYAANAARFRQSFNAIAHECKIPGYDDPKRDMLLVVKEWLEKENRGQWLMVIDNADDMELFFPSTASTADTTSSSGGLARHLPDCKNGDVLITTRNKKVAVRFSKERRTIEVNHMGEDESRNLLHTILHDVEPTDAELSKLSSQLEHLPLALVQAAAYINENSMTMKSYLELLGENESNVAQLLSEDFEASGRDPESMHAVAKTWMLSFRMIEKQDTLAASLLSLMGLLDRQAIPQEFLSHYNARGYKPGPKSNVELNKSIGLLKAFSLISISHGKQNTLDMHRLVQLVTQQWLISNGKMSDFRRAAMLIISVTPPSWGHQDRAMCEACLPHAKALLNMNTLELKGQEETEALLCHHLAEFLYYKGQYNDAEKLCAKSLKFYEIKGPEHIMTLDNQENLAMIYSALGRWSEAEQIRVKTREVRTRVQGEEHPGTLSVMNNLAMTYRQQGRLKEAEELQIKEAEELLEAEKLQEHVFEERKKELGEKHPFTLKNMHNLAWIWYETGRVAQGRALMQDCIRYRQMTLGQEHHSTQLSISMMEEWEKKGP
ncbi:hypothetical protein CDD81_4116 [Ophiocordyceps australis]|uniref:Nucleoside phosphorylase domain-containing protein n=1 Tax=Ophiocordyceps australis TaxID=1399860 RepID=A0A2C5Y5A8_9HYPO|nr:hypothetical protein CDD81_4116 [Ophiocordyceps australis]